MPAPDSPRTADKLAKSQAFLILMHASEEERAKMADKQWEKRYGQYENQKAERERHHREKIVSRQREVAASVDARMRELQEEEEEAKHEMMNQMIDDQINDDTSETPIDHELNGVDKHVDKHNEFIN